jgi:hypothetical protein
MEVSDCKSSFREINSYFSARLLRCLRCGTTWLESYHEDFNDTDIAAKWGRRTWMYRPVTSDQIAEIMAARNTAPLDIDTFAT